MCETCEMLITKNLSSTDDGLVNRPKRLLYICVCTSKMNIITIAFCFQFLIACWPKTDVIINLSDHIYII